MQYGPWLSQPREIGIFTRPRVLIREITAKLPHCIHGIFVKGAFLNNKSVLNVLHDADDAEHLKCFVGIVNSTPFSAFYKARAVKGARTVFPKLVINNLRELPYPKAIDGKESKALAALVDHMLALEMERQSNRDEHQREVLKRLINDVDKKIDSLCCQLFHVDQTELMSVEQLAQR